MADSSETGRGVSISVVTPTYDRPTVTREMVQSLRRSVETFDASAVDGVEHVDLECLICCREDDEPTILRLRELDWPPLEVLTTETRSASHNRNHAIDNANGEYVSLIDSDCIVREDWLTNLCRSLVRHDWPPVMQGAYYQDEPSERTWYTVAESMDDRRRFERQQADSRNLTIRRSVYDDIGGYDTEYRYAEAGEDLVLRHRIESAGYEFHMADDVIVRHRYPPQLSGNLRRFYRYACGTVYVRERYPEAYDDEVGLAAKWRRTFRRAVRVAAPGFDSLPPRLFGYRLLKRLAFTGGYLRESISPHFETDDSA